MDTHKDRHDKYVRRFLEAVGLTREAYEALDWTKPLEAASHLHPKAVPRVLMLMAERLIEYDPPGPAVAWWNLANAKLELGDLDDAIVACQRGIELHAGRSGVGHLRRLLQRLEREHDSARNHNGRKSR